MSRPIAKGRLRQRSGCSDFSVRMDPETASDIQDFARRMNMSFSEAVRTLCTWGIESEEAAR